MSEARPVSSGPVAPPERQKDNIPRGIAWLVAAATLFSTVNMTAKWLSQTYPVGQIVFFRSAVAIVPCIAIVSMYGGWASLRTQRVSRHAMRCFFGFVSLSAAFASFSMMPLGDAVALGYAGPLFITLLSIPLLGDKVGVHRWSAVAVGFLGVLLMANPRGGVTPLGATMGLANAFFYALSMISVRQLGFTETPAAMMFYHTLFSTLFSLFLLPFGWVMPGAVDLAVLCGVGLVGGVSQWMVVLAFRQAPPAALSPFSYIGLVWAMVWGWLVWGDMPGVSLLAGAALVVLAGLYILHREIKRGIARARTGPPA